jgi:hypothetical protein
MRKKLVFASFLFLAVAFPPPLPPSPLDREKREKRRAPSKLAGGGTRRLHPRVEIYTARPRGRRSKEININFFSADNLSPPTFSARVLPPLRVPATKKIKKLAQKKLERGPVLSLSL